MLSQRQIRFGELIRSILSESFLREDFFSNEINISTITVSYVRMSKDLRVASVYVMPLGGQSKEKILECLNEQKFIFQKSISNAKLKSKFTPKINFYIDNSFEEADRIENLLLNKKVIRDLKNE